MGIAIATIVMIGVFVVVMIVETVSAIRFGRK